MAAAKINSSSLLDRLCKIEEAHPYASVRRVIAKREKERRPFWHAYAKWLGRRTCQP